MKKYKLEVVIFFINVIYMILELIASRVLAPYFGTSNFVWTSIIGIIILSSSIGNYIGGVLADKGANEKIIQLILLVTGAFIFMIPIHEEYILMFISSLFSDIKMGAIISTSVLFFIPAMLISFCSPIIIKLKLNSLDNVGKTAGRLYSLAALGSITGTLAGGFLLIPSFGSIQILIFLSIILFLMIPFLKKLNRTHSIATTALVSISILCLYGFNFNMNQSRACVLNGDFNVYADYDTQYGRVKIYNGSYKNEEVRVFSIDKGSESATFVDEDKCYELVFDYTDYYNLMFETGIDISDVLMIGGAGYSYPKYYISHYEDKSMDVVEIDEGVTKLAKQYFYLDKLIEEFDLNSSNRLNIYHQDGRVYLNNNNKKYSAILNDAFSGNTPASNLTTLETVNKIYNSLTSKGLYLTNIISSLDGKNSKFLKAEVNTLKQVFRNVYVIPVSDKHDAEFVQNNMVIATDSDLELEGSTDIYIDDTTMIITDNYAPIDTLIPQR